MDIHKPKAAHSWREFAIEIGTIITGILIALALEQAVEAYHWRSEVAEARRVLNAEITNQTKLYAYRLAAHPCVQQHLEEIEAIVGELRSGRRVAPVDHFTGAGGKMIPTDGWRASLGSGVVNHMEVRERLDYSAIYTIADEIHAWQSLTPYYSTVRLIEGDPNKLSGSDLSAIRVAIGYLKGVERLTANNSAAQIERARKMGIPVAPTPDVSQEPVCQPLRS